QPAGNTSPPFAVMAARRWTSLTLVLMEITEPSAFAARKESPKTPSFGSGFVGEYSSSSGLVHGTAVAASTIASVLEGPSVIQATRRPVRPKGPPREEPAVSKIVPVPVKTR